MGLQCGIVGLPNVGKSTLFNALTSAGALAANYPFATKDPNIGVISVPDKRLDVLAEIVKPQRTVPTSVDILDIAGLIKGASKGEGLGNQFLANIREVDAILHVVRAFEDDNVVHVDGSVDPLRDKEIVDTELILKDIETQEKRIDKIRKQSKGGDKEIFKELGIAEELLKHLEQGKPARSFITDEETAAYVKATQLLTGKPVLYICNVDEASIHTGNKFTEAFIKGIAAEKSKVIFISAGIEAEIAELPESERADFFKEMGLDEPGVYKISRAAYELLNLATYFTAGEKEVRAWTIIKGMKAPQAAGVIHSDFEKGFIRAEVIKYDDFIQFKSEAAIKAAGKMSTEGKEYIVQDADIMHFLFNV
ncbi:MAG: redox-regulated ATPase YchF [Saprospiraceae bacterium]|nr:redox-regulated ATPase YchF [Saprospiraceae bacterium]MBK8484243.1 redox-regulated ATPase YchF [Saprospiraceae bacterium]MBK9221641.1 redox-regulated ATPase YchF [Saprospiraceae bacterium]MBK9721420.1 redox-regulated ATPase YchF [Saprospiraceae bacterium]MBK9728485.1 redox-regulated ATPase YchF [Saprospiraceae bacterium]